MYKTIILSLINVALVLIFTNGFSHAGEAPMLKIAKDAGNLIVTCPDDPKNVAAYNRRFAAKELADYLERIIGAKIPVVDAVDPKQIEAGGVIFVGSSNYTDALNLPRKHSDFGAGGYVIKTLGKNLAILGDDSDVYKVDLYVHGDGGTYYGVAAFLEKYCGVRWLWPGELGTVVPKRSSLSIPTVNIKSRPAYLQRTYTYSTDVMLRKPDGTYSWWGSDQLRDWTLFHRRHGSGVTLAVGSGHYLETYLKRDDFKTHPEYFAFYDGKRQPWTLESGGMGWQVCNSNPEVVKLFADTIVKTCPPEGGGFSICPNDGWGFCLCDKCKEMDKGSKPWPKDAAGWGLIPGAFYNEKAGGAYDISNRIWTFNNQVARLVAERAPQAIMGAYAYSCYVLPPEKVPHIEDNIYVWICDSLVTSGDPSTFKEGWEVFTKWGKKSNHLGLYGYYFGQNCRPHYFVDFLRKFHKIGGMLHYAEATQAWGNRWSENLVGLKAMWDPSINVDAVLNDYLKVGFGPGWQPMRKYLDLYEKACMSPTSERGVFYSRIPKFPGQIWSPKVRTELRSLLDEALRATKDTESESRVRFVEEGWELLDSMSGLAEAAGDLKAMGLAIPGFDQDEIRSRKATPEEVKTRIQDAKKYLVRLRSIMTRVEEKKGFSIPWFSRNFYIGAFWGDLAASWSASVDSFYDTLVEGSALPLPIEWKFQIDPKQEGEKAGWFKPDYDDSKWGKLRTDTWWEKQGFGKDRFPENSTEGYNGKAWYRVNIRIPESRRGQKVLLELGAVDESFTAWVNGKQCATFDFFKQPDGDAWQKPHLIDITDVVRFGEDNLISVEVVDLSGAGGIWKPCFVKFTEKKTE